MALLHFLWMLCVPLVVAVAVGLVFAAITAGRVRKRHARLVASLGGEGSAVRGRLVVRSEGCARDLARGHTLAAFTRWQTSARGGVNDLAPLDAESAASVVLVTDGGEIDLAGPLRITSGGDVVYKNGKTQGIGFVVNMTLAADDVVTAVGRLEETDHTHEADYREKIVRKRLVPPTAGGSIEVFGPTPRVRVERAWRHPWAIVLALPFLWLPWGAARDWSRAGEAITATSCGDQGDCRVVPTWRTRGWLDVVRGWWEGTHYRVGPGSASDCRAAKVCLVHGSCSLVGGRCRAARDEDCLASWNCAGYGSCSAVAGLCTAAKDRDCALLSACVSDGRCSAGPDGGCVAAKSSDCASTRQCLLAGECSPVDGHCGVASDADCAKTLDCRTSGRCVASADGYSCGMSDASCRKSRSCATSGDCSADPHGFICQPSTDDDCLRSLSCVELGECTATHGSCETAASGGGCGAGSAACHAVGACAGDASCAPRDDRDCEQSVVCKKVGACKRIDGKCRKSCADDVSCKLEGRCTQRGDQCVVASDADCRAAFFCAEEGRCAFDGKTKCVARSDDDCRASIGCAQSGACTAKNDACVVGGEADCRRTTSCMVDHVCAMKDGHCGQADDTTCSSSPACKAFGACTRQMDDEHTFRCVVKGDDDCKKSEVCKQRGWCVAASPKAKNDTDKIVSCFSQREIDVNFGGY